MQVGGRLSDIGHAVQQWVEAHGFSVVREFVGHGIGEQLHEEPQIPNYGQPGPRSAKLAEGMVLAIEPMVAMGRPDVKVLGDGWTAVTKDGSLAAHFEHTVAVTAAGPLVLTARRPGGRRGGSAATGGRRARTARSWRSCRGRCTACALDGGHEVTAHVVPGREGISSGWSWATGWSSSSRARDMTPRGRIVRKGVELPIVTVWEVEIDL